MLTAYVAYMFCNVAILPICAYTMLGAAPKTIIMATIMDAIMALLITLLLIGTD